MEKRYDFKRELLKVHKDLRRDLTKTLNDNEVELIDGVAIIMPKDSDKVIECAVRDFSEYLYTSMQIGSLVTSS